MCRKSTSVALVAVVLLGFVSLAHAQTTLTVQISGSSLEIAQFEAVKRAFEDSTPTYVWKRSCPAVLLIGSIVPMSNWLLVRHPTSCALGDPFM